ncbi:unnamed protein product [Polarella glacialis]|uniref:Uncharacterized protein n=1 Tax=Polarella glacialis TaxID=89957 RepID=A0A813IG03_POLGL|nr:unnamed protein product [Polarella glacialis]
MQFIDRSSYGPSTAQDTNRADQPRKIVFLEVAAADSWPLAGIPNFQSLADFGARMLCGEATLQPRLEALPVRMPFPKPDDAHFQGSIYESLMQIMSLVLAFAEL